MNQPEPLVIIGQGDTRREITERDLERKPGFRLSIGKLICLWLAFAVLAQLWATAKGSQ